MGVGRNTKDLVKYALRKSRFAKNPYGSVWCVFDKDSFSNEQFNTAIMQCEDNGMKAAWSNESIELWFLLHFDYLDAGIDRKEYVAKLNHYFKKLSINDGKYEKNLDAIYRILVKYGNLPQAIRNAEKLEKVYKDTDTPSERKPSTKVYVLVEELFEYLDDQKV